MEEAHLQEANFICNNNNFEGKFAIHFILQIITDSIKQQEVTTILEVTNPIVTTTIA